jgi:hypothetical protein
MNEVSSKHYIRKKLPAIGRRIQDPVRSSSSRGGYLVQPPPFWLNIHLDLITLPRTAVEE